jgi:hypothetical protein
MSLIVRSMAAIASLVMTSSSIAGDESPRIDFQVIHVTGRFAPTEPTFEVIRSPDSWAHFRKDAQVEGPGIDFKRFSLVIAATGQHGSSGFSVAISSVQEASNSTQDPAAPATVVSVLDVGPGSCPRLTETTRVEAVFALIPKRDQKVHFRIQKVGVDCTVQSTYSEVIEARTFLHRWGRQTAP